MRTSVPYSHDYPITQKKKINEQSNRKKKNCELLPNMLRIHEGKIETF